MANALVELLGAREWLLADGATGTNFFAMGLMTGDAPELWNVEQPERVAALHHEFVAAGADIILTNSFGGTRSRLALHGAEDRVEELNQAAARIARAAADAAERPVVVAGSMGPTGELFVPLGALDRERAEAAFAAQARALAAGGADVLWIETLSSREELEAAVSGAASTGLPVVCTMSFDTNGSTMMGFAPTDLAALCPTLEAAPVAFGTNCGIGAAEVVACILNMAEAALRGSVLVAKANCGVPEYVDGVLRYAGTPELMAEYARLVRDAGARIIGGCCGTTPAHTAAMRSALEAHTPGAAPALATVVEQLGTVTRGAEAHCLGHPHHPLGRRPSRRAQRRSVSS
jgi:methionine synthase I (cobalamin-dependent)